MSSADTSWWGPRIWRLFHCLAEQSDRVDAAGAWRLALQLTCDVLPCERCRLHFSEKVRRLRIPVDGPNIQSTMREFMWASHQGTTAEQFPKETLTDVYGGARDARLDECRALLEEVVAAWSRDNALDRFRTVFLPKWRRAILHLIHVLLLPDPVRIKRR